MNTIGDDVKTTIGRLQRMSLHPINMLVSGSLEKFLAMTKLNCNQKAQSSINN
jgi:hypothetical protein